MHIYTRYNVTYILNKAIFIFSFLFFIRLSTGRHLGCFYVLTAVNSAIAATLSLRPQEVVKVETHGSWVWPRQAQESCQRRTDFPKWGHLLFKHWLLCLSHTDGKGFLFCKSQFLTADQRLPTFCWTMSSCGCQRGVCPACQSRIAKNDGEPHFSIWQMDITSFISSLFQSVSYQKNINHPRSFTWREFNIETELPRW